MSEPLSGARFTVQIEGIEDTGVREVTLPDARIQAGTPPAVEYGLLVLRRGLAGSSGWYRWWDDARRSKRKTARAITVALLDAAGTPRTLWRYSGARPVGYAVSGLDAMASGAVIETLEVAVAGFEASFAAAPRRSVRASPVRTGSGPSK